MNITGVSAIQGGYGLDSSRILNNNEKAYFNQVLNKQIFSDQGQTQAVKQDARPGQHLGTNINRMI